MEFASSPGVDPCSSLLTAVGFHLGWVCGLLALTCWGFCLLHADLTAALAPPQAPIAARFPGLCLGPLFVAVTTHLLLGIS